MKTTNACVLGDLGLQYFCKKKASAKNAFWFFRYGGKFVTGLALMSPRWKESSLVGRERQSEYLHGCLVKVKRATINIHRTRSNKLRYLSVANFPHIMAPLMEEQTDDDQLPASSCDLREHGSWVYCSDSRHQKLGPLRDFWRWR